MTSLYSNIVKPASDYIGAILLLILCSPLLLLITIVLFIVHRKNPFFLQQRAGYQQKPFTIYKFRTLKDMNDGNGRLLRDEERMFPIGTFLRMTHLDELPQLVNILFGQLSFIGPRPLPPDYLGYYSAEEQIRHKCKPGIAGLSQIMAGNAKPWNIRLRYDTFYVRHISFGLDCFVLYKLLTVYFFQRSKSDLFCESFIEFRKRQHENTLS